MREPLKDRIRVIHNKQSISMLRGVLNFSINRPAKSSMEQAIDDIKHGRVYEASSVEDLINQCKK